MLRSKLAKLFMSILKWKVDSSSNFESVFIVMAHNPFVNFKPFFFLLWAKRAHQSPTFDTFECSSEHLPNFSCLSPNYKSSSNFASLFNVMKDNSSVFFQLKQDILCSKRRPLKLTFFWLLSAPVKIRQILYVNPEMASQFHVKFCIILRCHNTQLPCKL